jgi:membrane associated rhomboid family serine protease
MARPRPLGDLLSFGGRVPSVIGGLIAGIVVASLLSRLGGLSSWTFLAPGLVLEGELWRLLTWPFVDVDPLSLLFAALTLYWFGRDLAHAWGPRRFLLTWLGFGAASGLATVLLSLAVPSLAAQGYSGPWAVISALLVAWGLLFPERQMLLYMALPLSGRGLVWVTVGGTLFFAAFGGLGAYVPHLAAEGLVFLWFRGLSPRGAWQSLRIRLGERRLRRRAKHLRVIRKNGKGDPPSWVN